MMAQFSPVTRRVVALGIAVLALFGIVNLLLLPIYNLTAGSLAGLEDARFQRARLEAIAARPPLPRSDAVPHSLYLAAPDRQKAADALIAAIGGGAQRHGVQLDSVAPAPADPARPGTIGVTIAARGEQDKLLAWLNDLERGTPALYFPSWSLAPAEAAAAPEGPPAAPTPPPQPAAGTVTLGFNGTAYMVWEQRS